MPRQPPRRAPPAPTTPSLAQPPPVVTPVAATTTTPNFATPQAFQQEVEFIPTGNPAWQQQQQQQQQRRFNPPVAAMPDPLEDSDIENQPVDDDRARAIDFDDGEDDDEEDLEDELDDEDVEGDDENEEMRARRKSPSPLPIDLREISSLASWTVSTHKPGCGVAALRNPSPQQFWQSDGPQPHTLSLHFFKVVAIVKIRVYLDFDLDESYTPTKMLFFAGMGGNDLVQFATWEGETPVGWIDIPLHGVGGRNRRRRRSHAVGSNRRRTRNARSSKDDLETINIDEGDIYDDSQEDDDDDDDESDDPYAGNVLKAMVVQVRICENHQNGKDTHVRGFQVFAHDDDRRRIAAAAAAASADQAGHERRKSVQNDSQDVLDAVDEGPADKIRGLDEPDWMGEPVIR